MRFENVVWLLLIMKDFSCAVNISNIKPIMDTRGNIVSLSDGNIIKHKEEYLWFGLQYGDCQPQGCKNETVGACGFGLNHTLVVYASPDLSSGSWSLRGKNILPKQPNLPNGIYFRPSVLFNIHTKLFVLWLRWLQVRGTTLHDDPTNYLVATSPNMEGPFTVVNKNVSVAHGPNAADFQLFLDNDNIAYIVYTSRNLTVPSDRLIKIDRLTKDYQNSSMESTFVNSVGKCNEAPAMFKHLSTYYVTFGGCCCFCSEGSDLKVYRAAAPLGPYSFVRNVGTATKSQQSGVVSLSSGIILYQGSRWNSAPDGDKDHDFHYHVPFDINKNGTIGQLRHVDSFEVVTS